MSVSQNSGSPDGSGGRLIDSSQALLTSAANKSTAAPGHYCWRGEFHFTSPALADMSDSTSGECFIVKPVTPSLSTSATCSATPCILGSTLRDTATLTGAATKPGTDGPDTTDPFRSIYQGTATPTLSGTNKNITWTLFAPASDGSASCTNGTKTLSTSSVQANGNGTYPTTSPSPVSYTTTASDGLGIYTFAASYPADSPNNLAAPNVDCSTTNPVITEQVTVTSQATTTTAQKWLPQDTATVTALGGATVAGTVSFSLYESADCSGIAVQTFAPITVDSNGQATTNNQTYYTTTKTISWRATFTSSNNVGSGSPSHCETMSVSTLNNDLGPGS